MIIECINCNKKFNVDQNFIPKNGRKIQCGSCNYSWHYKIENISSDHLALENNDNKQKNKVEKNESNFSKSVPINDKIKIITKDDNTKVSDSEITTKFENKSKIFNMSIIFSYLIIFIISLGALLILVDTIKIPLINLFPELEIILFSLFETFKDMRLFIIDLV